MSFVELLQGEVFEVLGFTFPNFRKVLLLIFVTRFGRIVLISFDLVGIIVCLLIVRSRANCINFVLLQLHISVDYFALSIEFN